jgi:hypothetical protein
LHRMRVNNMSSTRRTFFLMKQKDQEVLEELQEVSKVKHFNRKKNGRFPSERSQGRISGS